MVFPKGANRKEFAADHLDRLLGKSILDRSIHEGSMAENGDACGANQPQKGGDGRRNESHGYGNAGQTSVELGSSGSESAYLQVISTKFANSPHAANDKDDVEKKPKIGEQAIDTEHDKDDGIVGGEVREIVVYTTLNLAEVVRL